MKKMFILLLMLLIMCSTTACTDILSEFGHDLSENQVDVNTNVKVEVENNNKIEFTQVTTVTDAITECVITSIPETTSETKTTECDHDVTVLSKAATCTEDGYDDRRICSKCEMILDDGTVTKSSGHVCKNVTYDISKDKIMWWCEHCDFSRPEEVSELQLTIQTIQDSIRMYLTGGVCPNVSMYVVYKGETEPQYIELEETYDSMNECNKRMLSFDVERVETVIVHAYDSTPYREIIKKFDVHFIDSNLILIENTEGIEQYLSYIGK